MVGVMDDIDCETQKVHARAPRVSLVVPLILLFDLLTCCCCLWALLVRVPWMQIH